MNGTVRIVAKSISTFIALLIATVLMILIGAERGFSATVAETEIIEQTNYGGPTAQIFYVAGAILFIGAAIIWFIVWLRKRSR